MNATGARTLRAPGLPPVRAEGTCPTVDVVMNPVLSAPVRCVQQDHEFRVQLRRTRAVIFESLVARWVAGDAEASLILSNWSSDDEAAVGLGAYEEIEIVTEYSDDSGDFEVRRHF